MIIYYTLQQIRVGFGINNKVNKNIMRKKIL